MNANAMTWARLRPIGKGSFGTVSLARDAATSQVFAAKSVDLKSSPLPSLLSLENEIRILSSLNSPYIVSYLGNDTTQEYMSVSRNLHIEYLPGGTATDAAAVGKMEERDVRAYTLCIARGLHYLHGEAGVVHGDVKGRNVLLGPAHGVAKLADFGSASRAGDGNNYRGARGTPLWMAPEVVRGEAPAPASDVWSLGCTVVEMAGGGAPPWRRFADAADVMLRIGYGSEVPEFPAGMSKAGQDFLDKCLRRDAAERWTSEQLLQHPFLAAAVGGEGPSPRSVLDWANLEFKGEGSDGEEEDCELAMDFARERVGGLTASGGGEAAMSWWESDDWEVVRGGEEVMVLEREEEEGSCREILNYGGENGCSVSCSCCSGRNCFCCGCCNKSGSWFQEEFGVIVWLWLLLSLCWMLIVFLREFNGIIGLLFHFDCNFLPVSDMMSISLQKAPKAELVCWSVCSSKTNTVPFLFLPFWQAIQFGKEYYVRTPNLLRLARLKLENNFFFFLVRKPANWFEQWYRA